MPFVVQNWAFEYPLCSEGVAMRRAMIRSEAGAFAEAEESRCIAMAVNGIERRST